jgi:hypothetical protein
VEDQFTMADLAAPKTPARGPRRREIAVVGEEMGGIGDVLAAAAGPAHGPKPPAVMELLTKALKVHSCFCTGLASIGALRRSTR